MRALLFSLTLLLAATTFAQQGQPGYPPSTSPQQTAPNRQQMPPDQTPEAQEPMGPGSQATASAQVGQEIQQALQAQPSLSNARINVSPRGNSVVLSGVVADQDQHQRALRVAALHASGLEIVDHIKVQQQQ
jgi:osmotically-inducible protein OsmY